MSSINIVAREHVLEALVELHAFEGTTGVLTRDLRRFLALEDPFCTNLLYAMRQEGLIASPGRGQNTITAAGISFLRQHGDGTMLAAAGLADAGSQPVLLEVQPVAAKVQPKADAAEASLNEEFETGLDDLDDDHDPDDDDPEDTGPAALRTRPAPSGSTPAHLQFRHTVGQRPSSYNLLIRMQVLAVFLECDAIKGGTGTPMTKGEIQERLHAGAVLTGKLLNNMREARLLNCDSNERWQAIPGGVSFYRREEATSTPEERAPRPLATATAASNGSGRSQRGIGTGHNAKLPRLEASPKRQRVLPPDPKRGTLDAEVLGFVRVSGSYGDAAVLTRLCRRRGFPEATEAEVAAALSRLITQKLIKPRRYRADDPEPFAYERCPEYADSGVIV